MALRLEGEDSLQDHCRPVVAGLDSYQYGRTGRQYVYELGKTVASRIAVIRSREEVGCRDRAIFKKPCRMHPIARLRRSFYVHWCVRRKPRVGYIWV